jgi:hypothetical protein
MSICYQVAFCLSLAIYFPVKAILIHFEMT